MTIHVQAVKIPATEDYLLIEEEHLQLRGVLNDLQNTCCNLDNQLGCENCTSEKMASCRGQLTSFFYNVVYLSDNHFRHEESIMRSRSRVTDENEYYKNHKQAHDNIMDELYAIVSKCSSLNGQGKTAEGYRQLSNNISKLLEDHDSSFDDPFIQSTKSLKTSVQNGVKLPVNDRRSQKTTVTRQEPKHTLSNNLPSAPTIKASRKTMES